MKAKLIALNINRSILVAFLVAVMAFIFSFHAHGSQHANRKMKLAAAKLKKRAANKKIARRTTSKNVSAPSVRSRSSNAISVVLPDSSKSALKPPASSIMFVNPSQRKLLAQNSELPAATLKAHALDAKLEGEMLRDSSPVVATPSLSSLSTSIKSEQKKDLEFSLKATAETASSINSAEKKTYSGELLLLPALVYNPSQLSLSSKLIYSRQFSTVDDYGDNDDISSPAFKARKTWNTGGLLDSIAIGPNFSIGAGKEARRQTFKGSIGPGINLAKKIGILSLEQALSYSYRFFEYDIRDDGTVNSPHSFTSTSDIAIDITKWFGVSAEFAIQQLINFQHTQSAVTTSQLSADFTMSEQFGVSLGLQTALASTLTDDGQSTRVQVYDPNATQAFLDLNLSF